MRNREQNRTKKLAARFRRIAHCEQGAELVELALTLPFFLLFVFAIMDFGRAWEARDQIEGAARIGAREAVATFNDMNNPQCNAGTNPCSVEAAVKSAIAAVSQAGLSTCGISSGGITGSAYTWTDSASCANGGAFTITVATAVPETDNSTNPPVTVLTTQVTVSYPYTLQFFGSAFGGSVALAGSSTMVNLN